MSQPTTAPADAALDEARADRLPDCPVLLTEAEFEVQKARILDG